MPTLPMPADSIDQLIVRELPHWLTCARLDYVRALHAALRNQQGCAQRMRNVLAGIPALDIFAEPLLEQALAQAGLAGVDVRRSWVVIAQDVELPTAAPNLPKPWHTFHSRQTLLVAALHNYREAQTHPSILRRARLVDAQGQGLKLSFEAFARLCRRLDLGGQYQTLLKTHLHPDGKAGKASEKIERLFEEQQRLQLEVEVRMAQLKGELDETSYLQMLPLFAIRPVVAALPEVVAPRQLFLLGKCIHGAVTAQVCRTQDAPVAAVIACLPGDPHGTVMRFASWDALYLALADRLRQPSYRSFFSRFILERDRAHFTATLNRLLLTTPATEPMELDGRNFPIAAPLVVHLRTQRLEKILDDARVLAVPTDDEDEAAQRERLQRSISAGLDLLSLVALFVPVLGEVMLAVAAVQVAEEVYEGYQDWRLGDRQAALDHLFGVVESVVVGGLSAEASKGAIRVTQRVPFVDALTPLRTGTGRLKLSASDLQAYRVEHRDLAVGEHVEGNDGGRLRMQDGGYLTAADTAQGGWRIRHPRRPSAQSLRVEGNGSGGWRHEAEQPQFWEGGGYLLRRLGSRFSALSDDTAEALLQTTGHDHDQVRHLHLDNAAAPARLLDALERHEAHAQFPALRGEAFDGYMAERQAVPDSKEALLIRDFPGLSVRGAREIIDHASSDQVDGMLATGRVPLALAEQARWYLRDSRLDRACAGLHQPQAVNADTERLALGLIDFLAPWPEDVRIEIRQSNVAGDLLAFRGRAGAQDIRRIVRGRRGYQSMEGTSAAQSSANDSLMRALLLNLDNTQQALLGGVDLTTEQLRSRLASQAANDRQQIAELIGMPVIGRGLRPPQRFADGRLGYALSGRGESSRQALRQGIRQIFPTLTGLQLEAYLLEQTNQGVDLWGHFARLQDQLRWLREALQIWQSGWSSPRDAVRRRRVATALRRSWRRKLVGAQGDYMLQIDGERIGSLPILPEGVDFSHVRRLVLRNMNLASLDEGFLRRFGNVVELDLHGNHLTEIPLGIVHLTRLRRLRLSNNRIVMDEQGSHRLGALVRLLSLDLSLNPLGRAPDLYRLTQLRRLSLRGTGIESLPSPIRQMSWRARIDLRDNRIRDLRQNVYELSQELQRLHLHDNPLEAASVAQVDELAQTSRDSLSFLHEAADAQLREALLINTRPEQRAARTALWDRLQDEPGSEDLFRFIADFCVAEDFQQAPDVYRGRIWRILEACERHEVLRARVFSEAGGERTCEDRLLLILSQLEIGLLAQEAVSGGPAGQIEYRMLRLGRSLYRLDEVDRFAASHVQRMRQSGAAMIDEIETRLFYRLSLTPALGLPAQPELMHYAEFSGVSPNDLIRAQAQVLRSENPEVLVESLAQRPFWDRYARERYADRFERLVAPFHQRLEEGLEQGANSGEFLALSNTLRQQLESAEQDLLRTLAREAYDRSQ